MKTLQTQYNLIKEGKGDKAYFMKLARYNFPDLITPILSYSDTITVLKNKSILSEGIGGLVTTGKKQDWHAIFNENMTNLKEEKRKLSLKQIDKKDKKGLALYKNTEDSNDLYYYDGKVLYSVVDGDRKGPSVRMSLFDITGLNQEESLNKDNDDDNDEKYKEKIDQYEKREKDIEKFGLQYLKHLKEAKEAKAEEKETTKEVTDMATRGYDYKDKKNYDNVFGQEFLKGFYTEMQDEKNKGKDVDELKAIVAKNLAKDMNYYVKDGQFGLKGVGYTTETPGLGESKPATGKHKSSGYGDLKESVLRSQIHILIKEVLAEVKK
jgi:hypothetical protein